MCHKPLLRWWYRQPAVDPLVLVLIGAAAWLVSIRLRGLTGLWSMPLSITAPIVGVLAIPAVPLQRLQATLEELVVRRVGSVVTLATFSAGAALVAFAMVATVASPELGSGFAAEPQDFTKIVGLPIAWGLWMVPAGLQTALSAIATDGVPAEWTRLRRVLACNTVVSLLLVLVLFGVLSQQLALLALMPFFQEN